ncbi:hypothetical protein BAZSYMA_ACONTIG81273_0 [Bathymodiolus azoricus thioautotrophic gill symbiont]|uniref:Uncharacterized protein n=1 Tax=Bathymodiolus azoricus thioautotrophic gill symbiont TaxID=235205 RepID=A0A1H6MNK8_9GAMM|nr:hypothetical protein BAZSYMA_ACONTIG81273_0 [Bathymodiolus azoricus thioautotrophic gill symbiont]
MFGSFLEFFWILDYVMQWPHLGFLIDARSILNMYSFICINGFKSEKEKSTIV